MKLRDGSTSKNKENFLLIKTLITYIKKNHQFNLTCFRNLE